MSDRYDIVILGAGNAGFGVSQIAHAAGKSIAFVEAAEFGGTCPNRGCTPKKVLVAAAQALHEIERASEHGIEVGPAKLDWSKLIERKTGMIDFIPAAMEDTAKSRGDVYRGKARFVAADAIEVDGKRIEADNFVIATGSITRPLSVPGAEHLITSDDVLNERELPGQVVFIGGGVIAMEFSHVYARAGAQVTILELAPRLLPRLDADAVAAIRSESERLGIDIKTGVEVEAIEKTDDGLQVHYVHDGQRQIVQANRVVNGSGRVANVADLNLQAADVAHDGIRIEIDEYLRSVSNPRAWVAGDALVHSAQLSPLATYEGRIVGKNIVDGAMHKPDYSIVPSAVYTVPAVASVGLTEAEARADGISVEVITSDMSQWFSARFYAETVAWSKILVEKSSRRVIGAHLVGHHGEELIHLFALAMRHGITVDQLGDELYAFPTFAADIKSMI
ncbi:MAG: NAD(P)/FAD-dependent oxidoreductase [Gammaproteobacteria bacterium]|nr:MAG: NAD(P)/FAD-dependent oxidoreductase [Gammaproteobacteria bacterium]UCH40305.1 MAG: NAD(P)/FAD-dependent oxidoreductase [Gammaproteobacteria bacterium]